MTTTNATRVAGLVGILSLAVWLIEGRGQLLQAGARSEPTPQAPATSPLTGPPPAVPRAAVPVLKVWPLTALSTERRRPTPKDGVAAGDTKTRRQSGRVQRSASAPPRATTAGAGLDSARPAAAVSASQAPRRARGAAPESPVEFDATVETILYSPERRLAIVDGQIVQIGDEIRGARLVDITPGALFFRDSSGSLRTLLLAAGR